MKKVNSNSGYFLERLVTAVLLTCVLMVDQQALPKTLTFSFSQSNDFSRAWFIS